MGGFSLWTISRRSAQYFARANAAIAAGIAATTAVITGALLIGDSVRGSLRQLVEQRLGNVQVVMQARSFFDPQLLQSLSPPSGLRALEPVIIAPSASVESRNNDRVRRATSVQVLAVDESFWRNAMLEGKQISLGEDQVALNASLAAELGIEVGQEVTIRLGKIAGVPGDFSLAHREDISLSLPRQTVAAILPDASLGGLSFQTTQAPPRNVYASLPTVADLLETEGRVNGAIGLGESDETLPDDIGQQWCVDLNNQLRPRVEDYGLELTRHTRVFPDPQVDDPSLADREPETVYDYYQLTSKELVIDLPISAAIYDGVGQDKATRMLAYLANSIAKVEPPTDLMTPERQAVAFHSHHPDDMVYNAQRGRPSIQLAVVEPGDDTENALMGIVQAGPLSDIAQPLDRTPEPQLLSRLVPYSIMVGIDPDSELKLKDYLQIDFDQLYVPYCWINSWLAEQTGAQAGDWLRVTFYRPETVDGALEEMVTHFMVAGVVPITEPKQPYRRRRPAMFADRPTIFNDPNMTPRVPGVTDQESISQWDLPFPLTYEILPVDDQYWNNHRLTPKLFLPYRFAASQVLFASRFGVATSIRVPAARVAQADHLRETIEQSLLSTRQWKGLVFQPTRMLQLQAASGTTPFDALFLSLSFFVIVAALLLVYLLLKLGLYQRAEQIGVMQAQGFTAARIRRVLLQEQTLVCAVGLLVGTALGAAYAWLLLIALQSWWVGAIGTRFVDFFVTPTSLLIGALSGGVVSLLAVYFGLRQLSRLSPVQVLRGDLASVALRGPVASYKWGIVAVLALVIAVALIVAGIGQSGMTRAGIFFTSGMMLLVAGLSALRQLVLRPSGHATAVSGLSLRALAWRSAQRNPGRSMLAVSMLAVASFLISSMSVFQMTPTERGYGGFDLIAESSIPILQDLGSGAVRQEVLGPDAAKLRGVSIVSFRARIGTDASCANLYQVAEPTILGVPQRMAELHDYAPGQVAFEWAATADPENPWRPLELRGNGTKEFPVPVILDMNTAAWSLKQGAKLGDRVELTIGGRKLFFITVGLLSNSVLQGKLLIGKKNFERLFPAENGFRFFMINSGEQAPEVVVSVLEQGWSDFGLDVQSSREVLQKFLEVQNTYISAFQALGALGLLLGTIGLAAVQLRSVLERRQELAIMQALGFAPRRLNRMIALETALLLAAGTGIGIGCAVIALAPYVVEMGPQVNLVGPLIMLMAVVAIGFVVAWLSLRRISRWPLLESLRNK